MKTGKTHIGTIVVTLTIGIVFGILLQKYCGIGNIRKAIDERWQTISLSMTVHATESKIPNRYHGKLQLFILAGQSNMSGRGDLQELMANPDPRIYVFGNDYHWNLAQEPVDDARDQVDKVSEDLDAGFSPAVAFATTLLEHDPDLVIGLIPCAQGNTSITEWQRSLSDESLYGACLKHVRIAQTMGTVAGLLFFQGETDAIDPKEDPERTLLPNQWADAFEVFVTDWRNDLNLPELPVVFAEIGTTTHAWRFINWSLVQEQQRKVDIPFCTMITTSDLPLRDPVHFTTQSYQIIGKRFAEAYMDLLQEQ